MSDIPGHKEDTGRRSPGFRDVAAFVDNAQESSGTKSGLLEIPSITLPQGGGAMRSIDEKFTVNAANGTASSSIPLPFSPGRKGAAPQLALSYNSGGGNSLFGLGWNVAILSIQRRTEKELPRYQDAATSDTFVFTGAEDLVPMLVQDTQGNWVRKTSTQGSATIAYYRPRIENELARIEQWNDGGNIYWRVRTKDNRVSVFGQSDDAKLFSPVLTEGKDKVFRWCLEYSYDDKGNVVRYTYKKENKENIIDSPGEKNHLNDTAPFTNIYCKRILYGNTTAWYEDAGLTGQAAGSQLTALPTDFLFELVFDYGEHAADKPTTAETSLWPVRQDPFSDFRAGFEIRTYRLCRRLLMFHHFQAQLGWQDYLVRSMELTYEEHPHLTYLSAVGQTGYIWNTDGSLRSQQSMPPLEFDYFKPGFSREVKEVTAQNSVNAPAGVDDTNYQWTDLYSEGIAGILSEQAGGWFYKENLGNGNFSPARIVSPRPSFTGLRDGAVAIQDLEGDGNKYLVSTQAGMRGYYALDPEDHWQGFRAFDRYPNIDLQDPNLKLLDLNGDGMPDMLISQDQDFIWYAAKGKTGYDDYHLAIRAADEEKGPQVLFADKDEKMLIATADMSGDGLADIVLITYAQVSYYPNLGYGRFGARVTMGMDGAFAPYTEFNPLYLHLADIDGSGTTDILYAGNSVLQVWYNQSGNSLSTPSSFFNPFPELDNQSRLSLVDLLGTGVACLVWSSALPAAGPAPLRYIDLMDGRKPHIMMAYRNNMGKEVTLEYKASTQYYLDDRQKGHHWVTKLPFPVQCVSKVTVIDKVSGTRLTNEYSYHHGYYDAREREFRGFARVDQRDCEEFDQFAKTAAPGNTIEKDLYQPAVITKTWYHTGAWLHRKELFHQLQNEYYPQGLAQTGGTDWIPGLSDYFLDERSVLPDGLEPQAISECYRALKGLALRQEVYGKEDPPPPAAGGLSADMFPYTVTQYDYTIQLLQPRAAEKYAVFFPHQRETLAVNYERDPQDPRIAHTIQVQLDDYGNVQQSASIVYGRKTADPGLPSDADRQKQAQQYVVYTQNLFVTPIDTPAVYRLPVLCETQAWELNAPAPTGNFFTTDEIGSLFSGAAAVLYEQATVVSQKRKIKHAKTLFLKNDLTGPAAFGTQDTLGLPYESYSLAFTATLGSALYGGKFDEGIWRNAGHYTSFQGDANYWIRSGRLYFHPDLSATPDVQSIPPPGPGDTDFARGNFYGPVAYEDNFGNLTKVFYDPYKLFLLRKVDAMNNETTADAFQYRVLKPWLLRDMNDNRTGVRFDELGRVTATFSMGKSDESKGDPIDPSATEASANDQPTTITEYAFRYYTTGGLQPDRVKTSLREQHYYTDPLPASATGGLTGWLQRLFGKGNGTVTPAANTTWMVRYVYSDGSGREVLTKVQAEPGMAPARDQQGRLLYDSNGSVQQADTGSELRWAGNGRVIYNNKGKAVKQYEAYFDSSPEYNTEEELVELGFSTVLYYDALGRLIRTVYPIGTFSKVTFDAWAFKNYDENDTVMDSDWYQARIGGAMGAAEQDAARKAAVHYDTPSIIYLDSMARPYLVIANNTTLRSNETLQSDAYYTRTGLDIEGNTLSLSDPRGNTVMSWKYDMLGNICCQQSMDGGSRWMLSDVMSRPLRLWDSRQQIFTYEYDALHRPLHLKVNTGAGDTVYEQYQYGEGAANDKQMNLRGKLYGLYDTAGRVINGAYDFRGNRLASTRTLLKDYMSTPDWSAAPALETEVFSEEAAFDALDRAIQVVAVDGSIFLPGYNAAGLLNSVDVKIRGAAAVTSFVGNIDYNARGQRQQISYGNNTQTTYSYEAENYRLTRLLTTGGKDGSILQDLNYTFDPVGNIIRQFDNAQQTVFYGGQQVAAQSDYNYDALYRLVEASGREHTGQIGVSPADNFNDSWCRLNLQPNSPVQLRNYSQKYFYDGVGNILKMQHIAPATASWTRTYQYNAANNQLTKTSVSGQNYSYTYNEHGSMLTMPQLTAIDWNFREEIRHAGLGGGGDAWYVYDSKGERIRKVIVKAGNKTTDRIYLGGVEIYRERTGATVTLERQTVHVMDNQQRIALVDSRTKGNDGSPAQLIRYQYANHLGSACLELDDAAKIISYEEYHPFGTTAYQATDASRQVPAKRYRYTGMERDEESGLNYHTARYYIPWLGRWAAADPSGIGDGMNVYAYVRNNAIHTVDTSGRCGLICELHKEAFKNDVVYRLKVMKHNLERLDKDLQQRGAEETPEQRKNDAVLQKDLHQLIDIDTQRMADVLKELQKFMPALTADNINKFQVEKRTQYIGANSIDLFWDNRTSNKPELWIRFNSIAVKSTPGATQAIVDHELNHSLDLRKDYQDYLKGGGSDKDKAAFTTYWKAHTGTADRHIQIYVMETAAKYDFEHWNIEDKTDFIGGGISEITPGVSDATFNSFTDVVNKLFQSSGADDRKQILETVVTAIHNHLGNDTADDDKTAARLIKAFKPIFDTAPEKRQYVVGLLKINLQYRQKP